MAEPTDGRPGSGRTGRSLPEHVTAPLLSLITQQALEEDYRSVAERRAREGGTPEAPRSRTVAVAAITVFGVLISVAAVQNSRNEAVDDAGRATLIARIDESRSDLEDTQARIADVTRENRRLSESLAEVSPRRQQTVSQLRRLQLVTGYLPARGEGVRIIVDDNPEATETQLVADADLAILVDGLWQAGAEAIAINNQRLNPLGSIRNVSTAIHVNTVPLSPPYVVRAIGDTRTLQADLLGHHARRGVLLPGPAAGLRAGRGECGRAGAAVRPAATAQPCRVRHRRAAGRQGSRGGSIVIAALGLMVGILLGLIFQPDVPLGLEPYLPIAVVAALDAVFGGLRAYLDGIFDDKVFVVSFLSNVVIAAAIVYLGDQLGVGGQLSTGVIVVLGIRIFSNVAAIRRHLFHA